MFDKQNDSGVSPVIGVILMVAVTVALVALVTVTVFDIGGDVSQSPDATVQLEQGQNSGGTEQIQATLLRNENVDSLQLQAGQAQDGSGNARTSGTMSSAGDTAALDVPAGASGDDLTDGETVNVIATMPDGSEEVLTSTDYEA